MRTGILRATIAVTVLASATTLVYWQTDGLAPLRAAEAQVRTAVARDNGPPQIHVWTFNDDAPPDGSGWGDWQVARGLLELTDETGQQAAYFLPMAHGATFTLMADVQLVRGRGPRPVTVYLGTDRTPPDTVTGTNVAVFGLANGRVRSDPPPGDCAPLSVRHFVGTHRLAARTACFHPVTYGDWHTLSLGVGDHGLTVSLDGVRQTFATLPDINPLRLSPASLPQLEGYYRGPYVAVTGGVARFRRLALLAHTPDVAPGAPTRRRLGDLDDWWVQAMQYGLYGIVAVLCLYMARHYLFTLNRLFGAQRHPYLDVDTADWPRVTVIIPAHNEEAVISDILDALLRVDYPHERLRILPVNDRSTDRTGAIIDAVAAQHPDRVTPLHRRTGKAGKAAVLQDAITRVEDEVVLVFDADYYPGRGLIKQLVAPFFDPEVGAVMGRVVPYNVGRNLLTRILDLERAGGYQVDQQARMNLRLVPQYGGTVGGIRRGALLSAGGWHANALAEDTDATMRLLMAGWKIVYQNRSECYEQVPETWNARIGQLFRWAKGHNDVLIRHGHHLLANRRTTPRERFDGLMVLNIYALSPLLLLGWALAVALWFLGVVRPGLLVVLLAVSYSAMGNFAIFSEIAAATYLDGTRGRVRLLPFMMPIFLVNVFVASVAFVNRVFSRPNGDHVVWRKTERVGQVGEWR